MVLYTTQFMVRLSGPERSALLKLARLERRDERSQAAVCIHEMLVDRGLLESPEDLQEAEMEAGR